MRKTPAPYERIAATIRTQVAAGRLRPGDRAPSTREITRKWGVAIATATKALTLLRNEGILEPVRGIGMIVRPAPDHPAQETQVSGPGERRGSGRRRDDPGLSRERVVRTGIALADAHGIEAVAMRRVAAELGVGVMSLYRHVQDRDELVRGMAAEVFGERELPEPPPPGWRARLELVARVQWDLYLHHTWLAAITSFTRPMLVPAMMAHTAWTVRALRGHGLSRADLTREVITLPAFIRGLALSHAEESAAARASGQTLDTWWSARAASFTEVVASDGLADLALLRQDASEDFTALLEYGLSRHLDGLAALIDRTRKVPEPPAT
ncbi:MAG TPA: TetR/AcrR family transcriptional regulator C-terminal domain-containing protein [Streptosporangiaceae bacterium]|jgi:AcrR family transcriptional regulator